MSERFREQVDKRKEDLAKTARFRGPNPYQLPPTVPAPPSPQAIAEARARELEQKKREDWAVIARITEELTDKPLPTDTELLPAQFGEKYCGYSAKFDAIFFHRLLVTPRQEAFAREHTISGWRLGRLATTGHGLVLGEDASISAIAPQISATKDGTPIAMATYSEGSGFNPSKIPMAMADIQKNLVEVVIKHDLDVL